MKLPAWSLLLLPHILQCHLLSCSLVENIYKHCTSWTVEHNPVCMPGVPPQPFGLTLSCLWLNPCIGNYPALGHLTPCHRPSCQVLYTCQAPLDYQISSFPSQLKPFGLTAVCQAWSCQKYVSLLDRSCQVFCICHSIDILRKVSI